MLDQDLHAARQHLQPTRSLRLLSLVIFTGLLLLVILLPIPYGAVEAWWVAVFECSVFLLTALWLVAWLLSGHLLQREYWPLLAPLFALVLYALVQTLPLSAQATPLGPVHQAISFDPFETRLEALRLLALACALALLLRYTDSLRRLRALAYTVIGVGVGSAIFGLLRQVAQRGAQGFLLAGLQPDAGYAQFINKNHFAFLAELTLGLLAGLIVVGGVARGRSLIYLALAVPVWAALVLSNSRGGVLALLCQIIFLALNFRQRPPRQQQSDAPQARRTPSRTLGPLVRLALACALVLSIVVGIIWVGGDPLAERFGAVRQELSAEAADPSQAGRSGIWRATWRLCLAHPFVGVGFGGYWMAITAYHDGSGALVPQQAHNDYLELWASGGLVALVLAGWFIYLFVSRARQQLADLDPFRRAVALGAATGLFGVAVHSLVDFGLHLTGIALVAVALVALAIVRLDSPARSLSAKKLPDHYIDPTR